MRTAPVRCFSRLTFVTLALIAQAPCAQNFPNKIIRIITAEPGGGADFASRLVAQGLTVAMGQQVIVESRGGASGVIAAEYIAKAPPDGYTLMMYSSAIWTLPLMQSVPYDPLRDFAFITLAVIAPNVLVAHPSLPVKSVKDLIALAKSRPGQLNCATGASGSAGHLAAELFKVMAGVDIVRIRYKGQGPALKGLLSGEVQMSFAGSGGVTPYFKSGRLRAIAVSTARPSALFPDLPTIAATGLPGYEAAVQTGMFAPSKTPEAIVNRLNQETVQVLSRGDVKEKFAINGVETIGSSPAEFASKVKSDMAKFGKLIKDAGIKSE